MLGPLLAGALLNWWRWEWIAVLASLLFFVSDALLAYWRRGINAAEFEPAAHPGPWLQPLAIALHHVAHLPGLGRLIALAAAENLVIGVVSATGAVLATGFYQRSAQDYALLQTSGVVATIAILLLVARVALPLRVLGGLAFAAIFSAAVLAGASPSWWGYAAGFVLVTGFDKMFNVYVRATRQRLIPPQDLGKTTGVCVLLNNLTQPLAGLIVGMAADPAATRRVVLVLALCMGALGALVLLFGHLCRPAGWPLSRSCREAGGANSGGFL